MTMPLDRFESCGGESEFVCTCEFSFHKKWRICCDENIFMSSMGNSALVQLGRLPDVVLPRRIIWFHSKNFRIFNNKYPHSLNVVGFHQPWFRQCLALTNCSSYLQPREQQQKFQILETSTFVWQWKHWAADGDNLCAALRTSSANPGKAGSFFRETTAAPHLMMWL